MQRRTPNAARRRLDALVGEWKMEASIGGQPTGLARADFRWLEDGAFLVQHVDAEGVMPDTPSEWLANSPFPITTIIGLDDHSDTFCYAYADGRGVSRVYRMSLDNDGWKIWGQSGPQFFQRFTGTFSEDANMITARWEGSRDGSNWEPDFDVIYTKVRDK